MPNQIDSTCFALLSKAESTYGTDPVPTEGTDLRGDISITIDNRVVPAARLWHSQSRVEHGVVPHSIGFSFTVGVGGIKQADAGTPGVHPFLVGSGYNAVLTGTLAGGDLEAAYNLKSFAHLSYAMYAHYFDKTSGQVIRLKMLGCRGNSEFVMSTAGELLLNVSGNCLYAEYEAAATITAPTSYGNGVTPLRAKSVTHTLGGTVRRIKQWSLSTNWSVGFEEGINGAYVGTEVVLGRDGANAPGGSIDPVALSTDFAASGSLRAQWQSATAQAHALSFNDGVSSFAYSGPKAQMSGTPPMQSDGAFKRFNVPYVLAADSAAGDDEVLITFGEV